MADFICKLGNENGEIIEKRLSAENEDLLQLDLEQQGYYVFNIKPVSFSLLGGKGGKKIKPDDFIIFNQEMKALLLAGLPVIKSLDILITRQKKSELGTMLKDIRSSIETGSSISEAFANHKDRLPTAYVTTLVAGERSGNLGEAIGRYVEYAKLTNTLRKNFKKALYYPVFLVTLSFGMIGLMLLYVLPEFAKFYDGFEEELPFFTSMVLSLADTLKTNGLYILAVIVASIIFFQWWRRTDSGARAFSRFMFAVPLVGNLLHKYQLSQVFHSLSVMLSGGMPLLSCLEDLKHSANNPLIADGLAHSTQAVKEGEPLTDSFKDTILETELSLEMIQVGENTGSLSEMLFNVADFYDEEVKNQTEGLLSLLEPALLLFMAIIVASLLFAMYYPIFNLMGTMGNV